MRLVLHILSLRTKLAATKPGHAQAVIQFYGLTNAEIVIAEQGTS